MVDYQRLPQHEQEDNGFDTRPAASQKGVVNFRKKSTLLLATAAIALLATSAYFLGASNELSDNKVHFEAPGISESHFSEGVAKCKFIHRKNKHVYPPAESRSSNPRFVNGTAPTLFRNGHIFDGEGEPFKGDLLIDRGIIIKVGGEIRDFPKDIVIVDLRGHILTPGIVDMHSHVGVLSMPYLEGTMDGNEMTSPITPFVRSIDGFNPSDKARERIISGGVTSSLILPGSGNIMGGEAFALKLRKTDALSVDDMLIEAGVYDKWRYMKMACGENPLRYYRSQGKMPSTRLGEGWLLRDQFEKATKLKQAQDDWCSAAKELPRYGRHRLATPFPEDLQYESLVAVLRDDIKLNIHCYETHDLEAMVRHSNEFKFKIAGFHHALDAYRVPEILKRAYKNVPVVATFASKFGYKKEASQSSVNSPKILVDAGIAVAMKSDHPIVNAQHLIYEAAQAHHFGLTEQQALASVTTVPAKAMGLDHRIGKIAVGMDADLVIWEKHPLALGAHPLQVYIDGIAQIEDVDESKWHEQEAPQEFKKLPELVVPKDKDACSTKSRDAIFTGIKKILLKNLSTSSSPLSREEYSPSGDLSVVILDGEVVCTGQCEEHAFRDLPVYDLGGEGVVFPSMISAGTKNLGLQEIGLEEVTGDGQPGPATPVVKAIDGLKFGGMHIDEAYKAGVLIGVTVPTTSEHVIQGISVAFSTGAEDALSNKKAILKERVALHVAIGQYTKSQLFPSISSQIGYLRDSLENALSHSHTPLPSMSHFVQVVKGQLPLVIFVENRDEMIRLIQLKKDLESQGARLKVTFLGATEAWTVAEHLAEAQIGVILRPLLCMPLMWESQRCLAGAPLTQETGISVLYKAGVKVGIAAHEPEDVRQLAWLAGWARSDLGLAEKEATGLVSWNLAELVGLSTAPSGLVIYNGDPFEFGAKVAAIVGGGKTGIDCNPRAF
ncbi:hypothetical protein BGZ74_003561 [Mortierella antarctica]|nr:hypothetical protein BGZ74_003561 [Mortierella antarctica]